MLGIGEGKFDPDGKVTREQMATILYRYSIYKKMNISGADASRFNAFPDNDQVAGWAKEAMIWATSEEVIRGTGSGIEPKNDATRAQVAQLIMNYVTHFNLDLL